METINLNIKKPKIIPSSYTNVFKNLNCLPVLFDIDNELFPECFFSQAVRTHFFYDTECDTELDEEITSWLDDNKKRHWFNIKKNKHGSYFCLGGDRTGLKYFDVVYGISILVNGKEVKFTEDYYSYYIKTQSQRASLAYKKNEWSLKNVIIDAMTANSKQSINDINKWNQMN